MSIVTVEELSGLILHEGNERERAIKMTGGKPTLVFPYLVDDFSNFAYFDKDLYQFNGTNYEPFTEMMMDRHIRNFYVQNGLENKYSVAKARELKAMIKFDPNIQIAQFDDYDHLVNLNNGIYNYDTKELIPHSKEYKFTYKLDVNYDKYRTECPTFTRFLEGCFADSGNWNDGYIYDKDTVENIIRLCGYLLYPRNTIEGLFIFLGEGSNGKSVLMDVLRMFFPDKYITNLSLNTISNEDGFQREKLIRSRINFCTEQRGGSINAEELKKVASGEGITVQRKFNEAFDFRSHTKIVVSANNMPYFNDNTYGILRRLYMFSFKNKFVTKKDYDKETHHARKRIFLQAEKNSLLDKLKEEKEAIFNLFLDGLERLKNDEWQFIDTVNMSEIKREYIEGSDTLSTWINNNFIQGTEDHYEFISTEDIYNEFKNWYYSNFGKNTTYSALAMVKKLRSIFRLGEPERMMINGRRITGYNLIRRSDLSEPQISEAKTAEELTKLISF